MKKKNNYREVEVVPHRMLYSTELTMKISQRLSPEKLRSYFHFMQEYSFRRIGLPQLVASVLPLLQHDQDLQNQFREAVHSDFSVPRAEETGKEEEQEGKTRDGMKGCLDGDGDSKEGEIRGWNHHHDYGNNDDEEEITSGGHYHGDNHHNHRNDDDEEEDIKEGEIRDGTKDSLHGDDEADNGIRGNHHHGHHNHHHHGNDDDHVDDKKNGNRDDHQDHHNDEHDGHDKVRKEDDDKKMGKLNKNGLEGKKKRMYQEFMKMSKPELIKMILEIIPDTEDLSRQRSSKKRSKSSPGRDPEQVTPSYRLIPEEDRPEEQDPELNNKYMSVGKMSRRFRNRKRLSHDKKAMIKCEDEMYEADMLRGTLQRTAEEAEKVLRGEMKMKDLGVMCYRCIEQLYGKQGEEAVEEVKRKPEKALSVILPRLRQKLRELDLFLEDQKPVWNRTFVGHSDKLKIL
ncbi:PREDICTED: sarcoplasmic reticulum histidine-rich calcium-binding protein-like [Tarenaya hassleriana]|uniref:sarcoplasmic reticulum histidine-rich calcium-binding protein-like n=1 Tax=Tarenaya hassleriana TaxID=28532 RepID=UPI00053C1403|nr:PREDICTED: sarcoplasmic reticulum histidine-rich calcium-binding protein-like [Tarenaya hassleriana]